MRDGHRSSTRRRGHPRQDAPRAARLGRRILLASIGFVALAASTVPAASAALAPAPTVSIAAAGRLPAGTIVGVAGSVGLGPSPATTTSMTAFAVARSGTTLYVADTSWGVIRALDLSTGIQRVIAGTATSADGAGDGGPAIAASLKGMFALAADASGTVYVATLPPGPPGFGEMPVEITDTIIRRIGPDGIITTVPGLPKGTQTSSIVIAPDGSLLVGDLRGFVRRVANGTATIVAGSASPQHDNGVDGVPATSAALGYVTGLALAPDGRLYVSTDGQTRRVDADGRIFTVALVGGRLGIKGDGNLLVTDEGTVSLLTPAGAVTHIAGCTCYSEHPTSEPSAMDRYVGLAIADAKDRALMTLGGFGRVFDGGQIVRMEADGSFTTVGGTGSQSGGDGGPAGLSQFRASDVQALPDGSLVLATNDELWRVDRAGTMHRLVAHADLVPPGGDDDPGYVRAVTVDAAGTIYATVGPVVRRVDPAGGVTTVAGNGSHGHDVSADGSPAVDAQLGGMADIAAGAPGELFISDQVSGVIRRVGPDGTITTIAGVHHENGMRVHQAGDGGAATAATFASPTALAAAHDGSVYVLDGPWDEGGQLHPGAVRQVHPDGTVTRVIAESLGSPITAIALDSADNLVFVTSTRQQFDAPPQPCVCQVLRRKAHGVVEALAGTSASAPRGSTGDGGPATQATVDPTAISLDGANNLFLLEAPGTRIREVVDVGAPPAISAAPPAAPVVAAAPCTG